MNKENMNKENFDKKKTKYYKEYYILFCMFCILGVLLLVQFVIHPRPQNLLLVLIDLLLVFIYSRWMNREKFANPYEYDKQVKEWKKRKNEAKKRGIEFVEKKPEKPKKMGGKLLSVFVATLFFGFMAYTFASTMNVAFPNHMPYEYKGDIAKLKQGSSFYDYSFFPDELPKDARDVKWIVMPSLLQGGGTEILMFNTSQEYIDNVVSTYGTEAAICEVEDDMYFRAFYDDTRLNKLTVYKLYDNDDWNHVHMWGFFVDEEIGRIGFFCE